MRPGGLTNPLFTDRSVTNIFSSPKNVIKSAYETKTTFEPLLKEAGINAASYVKEIYANVIKFASETKIAFEPLLNEAGINAASNYATEVFSHIKTGAAETRNNLFQLRQRNGIIKLLTQLIKCCPCTL